MENNMKKNVYMYNWVTLLYSTICKIIYISIFGSASKESTCNAENLGSIPGLGRSPEEGKGYPPPVFWPGEFHKLYSPWGHKESDMTEWLSTLTFVKYFEGQMF